MGSTVIRFVGLACMFLVSGTLTRSTDDGNTAETLAVRARQLQALWVDGTPRLRLRAELDFLAANGTAAHGQYLVDWISPTRWREEIRSGSYSRVRVHDARGYWQKSELGFQPEVIFEVDQILGIEKLLSTGPDQVFSKVKNHEKNGVREICAEIKWRKSLDRTLCFDQATGNLVGVEYAAADSKNPPQISKIEFSDFRAVGQKRVPFEIRGIRDPKSAIRVKVVDLAPSPGGDDSLLAIPEKSEFWAACNNMREPKLATRVHPNYPADARQKGEQGRVIFYAVIEIDGSVSHLVQIQKARPALDAAAAEAIRHWRYEPAVCDTSPVRTETSIAMDCWIEH